MIGGSFMGDEIDCGSFFDHIDDLLDFPAEDLDVGDSKTAFPAIWSPPSDSFPASDAVFCGNANSDLSAELSVPYEDIVHLEWLSNFVEDSFSGGSLTISKQDPLFNKHSSPPSSSSSSTPTHFQTSSPVSVLDSSTSFSGEKPAGPLTVPRCGRARTKRPRPKTFSRRPPFDTESAAEVFIPCKLSSDSAESQPPVSAEEKKKKKKKKIKLSFRREMDQSSGSGQGVRKCLHCEVTKTPQWRAGPMGPKTLCNACGVRYKSGRLFPEYRPAASPTFVPCLHSNSHRKVIEMRTKDKQGETSAMAMPTKSPIKTETETNTD